MTAKFEYIGVSIPTSNINHTALFKHGQTLPGFLAGNFQDMYYTQPSRHHGKNLQSREHDEVISRVIKAMGLSLQFVDLRGTRYANIYGKYRVTDGSADILIQLREIVRKYRRRPEPVIDDVQYVTFNNLERLKGILE